MPDLDLERRFDALAHDFATRPDRPGSAAAVATARRRRRTRIAGMAAVTAGVLMAVVLPQMVGGGPDASVVATEPALPPAQAWTAEALTDATTGWGTAWEDLNDDNAHLTEHLSANCLDDVDASGYVDEPTGMGLTYLVSDPASPQARVAVTTFAVYDDAESATIYDAVAGALLACAPDATDEQTYAGAVVSHASVPQGDDQPHQELWTARIGDRFGLVAMLGGDAPAPADAVEQVSRLLLGAMQVDESFTGVESTDSATDGPPDTPYYPDLRVKDLRAVAPAWVTQWEDGETSTPNSLPCVGEDWPETVTWSQVGSVGARGLVRYDGINAREDGTAQLARLTSQLQSCNSMQWTVRHTRSQSGTTSYLVATSTAGSVISTYDDNAIATVMVGGETTLSGDEADAVLDLLGQALGAAG